MRQKQLLSVSTCTFAGKHYETFLSLGSRLAYKVGTRSKKVGAQFENIVHRKASNCRIGCIYDDKPMR